MIKSLSNPWVVGIGTGIAVLIIFALLTGLWRSTFNLIKNIYRAIRVARAPLRIVQQVRGLHWNKATSSDGTPAMQMSSSWHVTNTSDSAVIIATAFVKKFGIETILPLVRHPNQNIYGSYPILPHATTILDLSFFIPKVLGKEGQPFKTTITIIDNLGNQYKLKNVCFNYR